MPLRWLRLSDPDLNAPLSPRLLSWCWWGFKLLRSQGKKWGPCVLKPLCSPGPLLSENMLINGHSVLLHASPSTFNIHSSQSLFLYYSKTFAPPITVFLLILSLLLPLRAGPDAVESVEYTVSPSPQRPVWEMPSLRLPVAHWLSLYRRGFVVYGSRSLSSALRCLSSYSLTALFPSPFAPFLSPPALVLQSLYCPFCL